MIRDNKWLRLNTQLPCVQLMRLGSSRVTPTPPDSEIVQIFLCICLSHAVAGGKRCLSGLRKSQIKLVIQVQKFEASISENF